MKVPSGDLLRSRVVSDLGPALEDALDCRLDGYAVLEPQETLLLSEDRRGVVTFEDGVPVLAYATATDRGGPAALADLAVPGPYRVELVSLPPGTLADVAGASSLTVPPGMPAERLAGDADLAGRTRRRAPADRCRDGGTAADEAPDRPRAVEAFLDDADKIEAIRTRARERARQRAREWGLDEFGE
jgi:hypothetical protein